MTSGQLTYWQTSRRRFGGLSTACAVILTIAFLSEAYPYRIPLYLPVVVLMFSWFALVKHRFAVPLNFGYGLFLFSIFLYFWGLLYSGTVYQQNVPDIQNMAGLLLTLSLLFSLSDYEEFMRFRNTLLVLCSSISGIIATLGLIKYRYLQRGVEMSAFLVEGRPYPWGTSLTLDYNFFSLALLTGAISSLYCLREAESFVKKLFYTASLFLAMVCIAFAGSRRGWITEALFIAILAFMAAKSGIVAVLQLHTGAAFSRNALRTLAAVVLIGSIGVVMLILKPLNVSGAAGGGEEARARQDELLYRLQSLSAPEEAFSGRSDRWDYSVRLLEDSSFFEILFGQGFKYLVQFEHRFLYVTEDYAHNPIISTIFYSGLIGASVAMLLLGGATFLYFRLRHQDTYFFALYIAALVYVVPSFNTLFSGKFFLLLTIIPWLIEKVCAVPSRYESRSYFSNESANA